MEWDVEYNNQKGNGYLTIYTSNYDSELEDRNMSFKYERIGYYINKAKKISEDIKDNYDDEDIEDIDLVGLNSNSFTSSYNKHHIFMEWDRKTYIPDNATLEEIGGMIIKTGGGIHLIKEADLTIQELVSMMKLYNCCPGFTEYSKRRGNACLRLCPKGDNKLEIQNHVDGLIYSVYRDFKNNLE